MRAMSPQIYHVLHVLGLLLLAGFTFSAFAAPTPDRRKKSAMLTGILSAVVLISGFGLQAKLGTGWPGWLIVKLVCFLVVAAMAGRVFKMPSAAGTMRMAAIVLFAVAVAMVYIRPF